MGVLDYRLYIVDRRITSAFLRNSDEMWLNQKEPEGACVSANEWLSPTRCDSSELDQFSPDGIGSNQHTFHWAWSSEPLHLHKLHSDSETSSSRVRKHVSTTALKNRIKKGGLITFLTHYTAGPERSIVGRRCRGLFHSKCSTKRQACRGPGFRKYTLTFNV